MSVGSEPGKSDIAKYVVTNSSWYLDKANLPAKIFWSVRSIDASKKISDKSQEKEYAVLGLAESKSTTVSFYPNPVKDLLHINANNKIKSATIYNISGQVVDCNMLNTNSINFSKLSKGVYFVEVILENGKKINQKIIKN